MTKAPDSSPARGGAIRAVAALVLGAQVVVLLGFAGFYLYELVRGEGDSVGRVVVSIVLILVTAVGLGAMARAWWGADTWPRTPTLVWSVLLLPVAWGLFQGHQGAVGALVGVCAVAGSAAALATPSADRRHPSDIEG